MRKKIQALEAVRLGARIQRARLAHGFSLKEVYEATGIDHSQTSRIERGQFKTSSTNVQLLCTFLGVSHSTLTPPDLGARTLQRRFVVLLQRFPGSADTFSKLFDMLEASTARRSTHVEDER